MNNPSKNQALPEVGVIFFSEGAKNNSANDVYDTLFSVAKIADENGFSSLWTPERHFQKIGGPYPNPSVLAAALSQCTKNIAIRAGSVNLSLHDPIRVAEEWAVVDNLSKGRVGMAFAAGWHPGDFILNPDVYQDRKALFNQKLEQVRTLWEGGEIIRKGVNNTEESVSTFPRPIQSELQIWLTVTQNIQAWEYAARQGFNVLTALISQDVATLTKNIAHYQKIRQESGHGVGKVTLMLHTYVEESDENYLIGVVKTPLKNYLSSFLKQQNKHNSAAATQEQKDKEELVKRNFDTLLELSFNRYRKTSSLIGNKQQCRDILTSFKSHGVDEVVCLLDYGLTQNQIISSVENIADILSGDIGVVSEEVLELDETLV